MKRKINDNGKKNEFQFPIEKFPRLEAVQKQVESDKELIELLKIRKALLLERIVPFDEVTKENEFENNENLIKIKKTDSDLASTYRKINEKESGIKEYIEKFIKPAIDCIDEEYDTVYKNAEIVAKKDATLKSIFDQTQFELFAENWEHKFNFFIAVKNYLYPTIFTKKKKDKK